MALNLAGFVFLDPGDDVMMYFELASLRSSVKAADINFHVKYV